MKYKNIDTSMCSIYLLRNKINTKIYVGQTWKTLESRWSSGYKKSWHIFNAINLYGVNNFYYETVAICYNQEDADLLEDYFISKLDTQDREKGYNLTKGGSSGKHSDETKIKMSIVQKEHFKSHPERREKMSKSKSGSLNPNYGKKLTEEQKQALKMGSLYQQEKIDEINRLFKLGWSVNKIASHLSAQRKTIKKYIINYTQISYSQENINEINKILMKLINY